MPGGCLRTCDYRLSCGHMCPYKVCTLWTKIQGVDNLYSVIRTILIISESVAVSLVLDSVPGNTLVLEHATILVVRAISQLLISSFLVDTSGAMFHGMTCYLFRFLPIL